MRGFLTACDAVVIVFAPMGIAQTIDKNGRCHDVSGKLAKTEVCKSAAPSCRDRTTKKSAKCGTPNTEPVNRRQKSARLARRRSPTANAAVTTMGLETWIAVSLCVSSNSNSWASVNWSRVMRERRPRLEALVRRRTAALIRRACNETRQLSQGSPNYSFTNRWCMLGHAPRPVSGAT